MKWPHPPSEYALWGMGKKPKQASLVLVPIKKTSVDEINSLVGLFNDYRKVGEDIVRLAREIRDRIDKGGEVEPSFHDVTTRTHEDGADKVTQLWIDGRSVVEWMGKDVRR